MYKSVKADLISAVQDGNLRKVNELISYGLSYSPDWSDGYVLLCYAIQEGHVEVVKLLLYSGAIINSKCTKPSNTPFHFAVKNKNIEIIEILLNHGADVDARDKCGFTPLFYALNKGSEKVVKLLLNHGASVDISSNGKNAIHLLAMNGNLEIIQHLLCCGAHIDCRCTLTSKTPLHFAVKHVRGEVFIQFLLNKSANVNIEAQDRETPLYIAAMKGNEEIVKLLLSKGATVDAKTNSGLTPLHISVLRGHAMVVKLLLQSGANVDASDNSSNTILSTAVEKGYSVIADNILKYSPDLNNSGNRSLLNTAVCGYEKAYQKIVESLLLHGVTVKPEDVNNSKLMHSAVDKGYLEIVEDLLKHGADVNIKNEYDFTPLHTAVIVAHIEIIKLLLSKGANVNAKGSGNVIPLHHAAKRGNGEIIKLLLNKGANINARDKFGYSPFLYAVRDGHTNLVEIFFKYKVDANSGIEVDEGGFKKIRMSALHIAVINSWKKIIKILLKYGAVIDIKDEHGNKPLHIACLSGCEEIVNFLLEHGSDINLFADDNCVPLECGIVHPGIVKICQQHIIKMKIANFYVTPKNLYYIGVTHQINTQELENTFQTNFSHKCEKEMEIMKCTKIGTSNVSFHDILTSNVSQLTMYVKNEDIVEVLRSNNYKLKLELCSLKGEEKLPNY